jgi:hypothetical protein
VFAQIFVIYTVALITQYGMALWWIVGVAVAFGSRNEVIPVMKATSEPKLKLHSRAPSRRPRSSVSLPLN